MPRRTLSSCWTAAPNSRLSIVGTHSGIANPEAARRVKNSNALATAATICSAWSPPEEEELVGEEEEGRLMVKPNRASKVTSRVRRLKST
jgi:hypothetical protein